MCSNDKILFQNESLFYWKKTVDEKKKPKMKHKNILSKFPTNCLQPQKIDDNFVVSSC